MNNFKNNLTEGSVGRRLLRFCVPFLLSNLVQAFYNIADVFIVGKFDGPTGISGVTVGGQVIFLITNLVIGLTVGGTVLVAQYIGAKQDKEANETISTMFSVMFICGIAATILIVASSDFVLKIMQTPEESFNKAKDYVNICGGGIIFTFLYNGISAVMRGLGDSKHPLVFVSIACVVNVLLDIIFVGAFRMSAAGSALTTVIAQALSVVISVIYLKRAGFMFDFKPKSFKINKSKLVKLFKIGLPASLQNVIVSTSFLILTFRVNGYGVNASAAVGIAGKFNSLAILPALAMSLAVASMAGQNIGAKLYDRAEQTLHASIKISFAICGAIFVFTQLFPEFIIKIFDSTPEVIEIGTKYLRAFSFDYLIVPVAFSLNGLFNGAGYTVFSLFNASLSSIFLRVPMAYLLGTVCGLGIVGIALAAPAASLGAAVSGIIFYKAGRWRKSRIKIDVMENVEMGVEMM